jgi:hypothetical protein
MSFVEKSTTRREFVKDVAVGAAGLAVAGSLGTLTAAADETKYKQYVHKLVYKKGRAGPGSADAVYEVTSKELNGRNTNYSFGYYSKVGAYGNAGLVHPYDTCLAFVSLDPAKPDYLGAEIEVPLGKGFEKHVFDVPTIVCVPQNTPYGPIVARKVEKVYAHYAIGLAGEYKATKVPVPSKAAETNEYGNLVKKLSAFAMGDVTKMTGPGNAFWIAWPRSKALEGFMVNFCWGFYNGIGNWHREGFDPHVHVGDEFLNFVGLDPKKPNYLGATLDMHMGEDARTGKKQEVYPFDTPTVIVCPAGFKHAPIITTKVDKTFSFFLIRTDTGVPPTPNKTPDGYPIQ